MEGAAWTVDVHELFCHYNALYFDDSLGACTVSWTSDPIPSGASDCDYYGGGCDILLSVSVLRAQSINCLKNILLHEMIHAYMCIHHGNRDRSDHGQTFQLIMNSINSKTVHDPERPDGGYNIIMSHEIPKEDDSVKYESRLQDSPGLKGKRVSSEGDSPSSSQNPSKNVKRIFEIAPKANALTSYYSEQPTKNCSPTKLKRRKLNKDYAVIIEWLEVFTDEESDEDVQMPLVNKRTERRKQQMCSVTEVAASSVSIPKNETEIENELEKHGMDDKVAIDESLKPNEKLSGLSPKCRNEVVQVSDG
ncbi:uncharacterized protein LOC144546790 [Carex rostrata]